MPSEGEPSDGVPAPADPLVEASGLLDEVLRQTLKARGGQDLDAGACTAALLAVAARYSEAPFELEPIVVELVEGVLSVQYGPQPSSGATVSSDARNTPGVPWWQKMVRPIAQTLFDDPIAHERIKSIWNQLISSSRLGNR